MDDSPLEYRVLGPLAVLRAGSPLDLGSPRQRALLALLLTEPNRVVPLDRLVDLLWRDEPPDRATATIQVYISRLRKILEPQRPRRSASGVLQTEAPGYRLNVPPDRVDAVVFGGLVDLGQEHLAAGRAAEAREALDCALDLWRGDAFAEFAAESFAIPEATRLEELRMVAEEARLDALLDLGRAAEVASRGIGLIARHPLRERLRCSVMLALYRDGRQAEALAVAEDGRRRLREDLGLDPSPDLVALEQAILEHNVAPLPVPDPPGRLTGGATVEPSRSPRDVLLGREKELAAVRLLVDNLTTGHGCFVGIPGQPGIGKTRLAEEIGRIATDAGATVLWARSQELTNPPPYWPLLQVIRSAMSQFPGAADLLRRPDLAALETLVPQTHQPDPDPDWVTDLDLARSRLIDAAMTCLRELPTAVGTPLVVVLDDLHWADADSLAVVEALVPRTADTPLLLVGTARTTPSDQSERFSRILDALARERNVVQLNPRRLSAEHVAELGELVFGEPLTHELAALVHAKAGGNPFFTVELLELLAAERSRTAVLEERLVPSTVQAVVGRRLRRLPQECVSLLSAAAVQGYRFDLESVADVCALTEDRALDLLEMATASGLVVDDGRRWEFRHALVADAIVERLSPTRRARIHAQIARSLTQRHRGDDLYVFEICHHWIEAVPVDGPEPALEPLRSAASAATRAHSLDLAVSLHRRRLELLHSLPTGPERNDRELDILVDLVMVENWASGHGSAEVLATLRRALELSGRVPTGANVDALTRVLYAMWIHHTVRLETAAAEARQLDLQVLADRSGSALAALIALETAGGMLTNQGKLEEALAVLDEAAARMVDVEAQGGLQGFVEHPAVHNAVFRSLVCDTMGDRAASDRHLAEARRRAAGEDAFTRHFAQYFGWIRDAMRHDPDAVEVGIATAGDDESWAPFVHATAIRALFSGWVEAHRGDHGPGIRLMRSAQEMYEANGARRSPMTMALTADAMVHAGLLDQAIRTCDEAIDLAQSTGLRHWLASLFRLRGLAKSQAGDAEAGVEDLRRAIELADAQGAHLLRRMAEESLAGLGTVPTSSPGEG